MGNILISPSFLSGKTKVAPSKSQTMRAILFASLADGLSTIKNPLISSDTEAMIKACSLMGAKIEKKGNCLLIEGTKGKITPFKEVIDAKNSGLILRFLAAIATRISTYSIITGDRSIRYLRHSAPLLDGINHLGGWAISSKGDGKAPLIIRGPLSAKHVKISGADSQNVSALLIASAIRENETTVIEVDEPREKPFIDMTISWLNRLQIPYSRKGYEVFKIKGVKTFKSFDYTVPSDLMSASYLVVSAILTNSTISIENISLEDTFDVHWIEILKKMKANIRLEENILHVLPTTHLKGGIFDINDSIDALPLFAVLSCFAKEKVILKNCSIARKKESDRLEAISQELTKMGAKISATEDSLIIDPAPLKGARLISHSDHRIAMSLSIAAFAAEGNSVIKDAHYVNKSFPSFVETLQKLGGQIQWQT